MINFIETLFGITIASLVIAGIAYVQSRSGGERALRYRERMQRMLIIAGVCGVLAGVLEIVVRL
jgi:hypothetical protein